MTRERAWTLELGGASAFQSAEERRRELAQDIVAASYLRGGFVGDLFQTRPTVLRRLAAVLADRVPATVDRLAALEPGAVPIAAALSLETGLPFVIVRGRPSGVLHAGESVLLIEAVVTGGGRAIVAARLLAHAGARVAGVLAVVDREAGAREAITAAGYEFAALFDVGELHDAVLALGDART